MRNNFFILFFISISKISFIISSSCSENCKYCTSNKICTRCEQGYSLVGTNEFDRNNEIKCQILNSLDYYFVTDEKVYYPCVNDEYAYYKDDITKCYRKKSLEISLYYTGNGKKYYPCGEGSYGIEHCSECKYLNDGNNVQCLKCQVKYAFLNGFKTSCVLISSLDNTYYKVDDTNYASCSKITNCIECDNRYTCTKCNPNYFTINSDKHICIHESNITSIDKLYLEGNTYYSCDLNGGVSNCLKCNNKIECIECNSDYTIVDGNASKCIRKRNLNLALYYTLDNGINYISCSSLENTNCLQCDAINIISSTSFNVKCYKCLPGYVFVDLDDSKCYLESNLGNEYYKEDNNHYKSCSTSINNCLKCESKNHCIECSPNFGIIDNVFDECKDITQGLSDNTIFLEDGFYYSCSSIEGCKKCNNRNKCIETNSEKYCILEGEIVELNGENDQYYLVPFSYTCNPCSNRVSNCHLCTADDHCNQCDDGYTIIIDGTGIYCNYLTAYSNNEEYFTTDNGVHYYQCGQTLESNNKGISNCEKCIYNQITGINNCLKCQSNFIILDDNGSLCINSGEALINNQIINKNIIEIEPSSTKYYSCNRLIENCETCNSENECITCKTGYIFLDGDKSKCLEENNYKNGSHFKIDSQNYCSCIPNCYECITATQCEPKTNCIVCDEGYELNDYNNNCQLILNNENDIKNTCKYLTITKNEYSDNTQIDESNLNFDRLVIDLIFDYYSAHKLDRNHVIKYINDNIDYQVIIFKNENCSLLFYENNGLKINSTEIITELKKIETTKDVIQSIIVYKNYTALSFYDKDGNKIDISNKCPSCLSIPYTISYNYKNKLVNEIGEKFAELVQKEDLDIFNENADVFQTLCKSLQIDGIDVPLNIRNYLLYQGNLSYNYGDIYKGDMFACNVGCTLISNNPKKFSSECSCELNYDLQNFKSYANEKEEENSQIEIINTTLNIDYKFLNNSKDTFEMFVCSSYAFKPENIKKNAGFYVVLFSSVSQGICFIALFLKLKINSFAKLLILANPPRTNVNKKNMENSKTVDENKNKRILKRVSDVDYYITNPDEPKGNNININVPIVSTQKRLKYEEEDEEEEENKKNLENNGEIHHQRLNIFNNNYVTPGKIKLGKNFQKEKNEIDTNNEEDIFSSEKNSEMDYYPVMKFIEYDINAYRDIGYTYEQKDIKQLRKRYEGVKLIQYNLLNKNEKTKLIPLIYKSLLKDHMPYKYGLYYDKRSFCSFYFYLFCLRNAIINLFINSNHNSQTFIPFSVKLIKLIFLGMTVLFCNAMFINQKYIYNKYNFFDKKYNFKNLLISDTINSIEKLKYALNNTFGNSILAYIIIMVVDIFLTWLFSIRRRVKNLLDEYYAIESDKNSNTSRYNRERKNFEKDLLEVSDLKNTYMAITAFFYVFVIIFFIYLVNFCGTYKGVVTDLFLGGLWTFIIYFLMPIVSTLFITGLRYMAKKMKIECIYNLSRILMEI